MNLRNILEDITKKYPLTLDYETDAQDVWPERLAELYRIADSLDSEGDLPPADGSLDQS